MKLIRLLIVALLAVVLPLRGALAVAATCEDLGPGSPSSQGQDHAGDLAPVHGEQASPAQHTHHVGGAPHQGSGHSHDRAKHLGKCTPACSLTPLAAGEPHVAVAPAVATQAFAGYTVPVASFITAGLERPPRTL